MNPQLNYRAANEHIADLTRAAERERFTQFAKHESLLARLIARVRSHERLIFHRAPARLSDGESATGTTDAAAAEA
jgi:hypothetical protein